MLWAASKSVLSGVAVLAVATGAGLVHSAWALVLPAVAFLIGVVFAAMGLLVSSRAQAYDFFTYYFTLVITVMYLFSGVFFPVESLPAWARIVAWGMPLTHAVTIVRAASIPSIGPFRRMSIRMRSGLCNAAASIAAAPLPTMPATVY